MSNPADAGAQAVLGGTFNPIHNGHLRCAMELTERMAFAHTRLMPSAQPPHREIPQCSAEHRAAMVELAIEGEPRLSCDRRELLRDGPSYTVDSLRELRDELGAAVSLSLVMGYDALQGLARWHRWRELLDFAHVLVIARPGSTLPDRGEVADWLREHRAADQGEVTKLAHGKVWVEELRLLPISSTEIRGLLQSGQSARYLLPQTVLDYIHKHGLYN